MSTYTDFDFEEDRLTELSKQQAHSMDSQLHVTFYKHAELNSFESRPTELGGKGRKIFDEHVYIRILIPANRLNVIERRATLEDKQRFARQWAAYVIGAEQLASGTPLDQLPSISASQVLELKHLKVDTIEQLAGVPDTVAQLMGTGGSDLKRRAQLFLARADNGEALASKVNDLERQLRELLEERTKVLGPADVKVTTSVGAAPTPPVAAPATTVARA